MAGGMTVLMLRCVLVCIWLKLILAYEKCERIDKCSCSTDERDISLWGLAESGDRPRFADIPSNNGRYKSFSWNPCISYSVSKSRSQCRDVAACAQTMVYYYYAIAKQDTATCVLTSGQCALKYTMKSWSLTVTLKCDESLEGRVEKMNVQTVPSTAFDTVLNSYYACPKSPPPTLAPKPSSPSETAPSKDSSSGDSAESQSSGLSLGSKLIITFCCLSVAYIIFGTLINKYGRHMEGREAFPNYSFWSDLPHLMKWLMDPISAFLHPGKVVTDLQTLKLILNFQ